MDCEKQKDEISALESIYNKEFSYCEVNNCYNCNMKIFPNVPTDYYITYKDTRHSEEPVEKIMISHLPPLSLCMILPKDYPSTSPPNFTLSSSWLHQLALVKLCKKLDKLWEENKGQEILFLWIGFLQEETLKYLNIQENLPMDYAYTFYKMTLEKTESAQKEKDLLNKVVKSGAKVQSNKAVSSMEGKRERCKEQQYKKIDKRAVADYPVDQNPVQMLIDYNEQCKQVEFKSSFYTCKICLTDKSGQYCTQFLPCSHVFCKECIAAYLEVKIKEKDVQNICCPEEKCTSKATPDQIKDLVSADMFAKYDSTLLIATLDTMSDIVYCPRRNCQYPASRELDEQMGKCPVCQYAFCVYCKMAYHGIEPCKASSADKQQLVAEYQTASDERKIQLEQRYGKKQLKILVENTMSQNWIDENSHNCPHCKTAIEKSDGCNKMTCWRCKTFFCWLCGAKLNHEKPYLHFQNPQSKCFNLLYHGTIPDEEDDDDDDDDSDDEDTIARRMDDEEYGINVYELFDRMYFII